MDRKLGEHDSHFQVVFRAIRELMQPPDPPPRRGRIGFGREHET